MGMYVDGSPSSRRRPPLGQGWQVKAINVGVGLSTWVYISNLYRPIYKQSIYRLHAFSGVLGVLLFLMAGASYACLSKDPGSEADVDQPLDPDAKDKGSRPRRPHPPRLRPPCHQSTGSSAHRCRDWAIPGDTCLLCGYASNACEKKV